MKLELKHDISFLFSCVFQRLESDKNILHPVAGFFVSACFTSQNSSFLQRSQESSASRCDGWVLRFLTVFTCWTALLPASLPIYSFQKQHWGPLRAADLTSFWRFLIFCLILYSDYSLFQRISDFFPVFHAGKWKLIFTTVRFSKHYLIKTTLYCVLKGVKMGCDSTGKPHCFTTAQPFPPTNKALSNNFLYG